MITEEKQEFKQKKVLNTIGVSTTGKTDEEVSVIFGQQNINDVKDKLEIRLMKLADEYPYVHLSSMIVVDDKGDIINGIVQPGDNEKSNCHSAISYVNELIGLQTKKTIKL